MRTHGGSRVLLGPLLSASSHSSSVMASSQCWLLTFISNCFQVLFTTWAGHHSIASPTGNCPEPCLLAKRVPDLILLIT